MSSAEDLALLDSAVSRLKSTGQIEYRGEFGAEITTFIPFVHWLKNEGLLSGRRVLTHAGMRPYYYFLDDAEYAEKAGNRAWLPIAQRDWPSNSSYTATREPWHHMPDYRARYRDEGITFERPVLFIQNKFCVEWNTGPINYIPLNSLDALFRLAGGPFDIVYSRPRAMPKAAGYAEDDNVDCDYPDFRLASEFPRVMLLERYCAESGAPYNRTKLRILAKSHLFVTVQGGGAHLLACFGNALMLLLHREGPEFPHAYQAGPYKYLSHPAPILMLARNSVEFNRGASLIANTRLTGTELRIGDKWIETLNELRI